MTLRVITAPSVEPVSLDTVKAWLRIDGTYDDTLLMTLISAARESGEQIARRAFITQTLEMTLDAWPVDYILRLLRPPLLTVTTVKYLDEEAVEYTISSGDYHVDTKSEPGRIIFDALPSTTLLETGGITVRYTAGYGATSASVPNIIKHAVLMLTAYWYENREMGNNVPEQIGSMFMSERAKWF